MSIASGNGTVPFGALPLGGSGSGGGGTDQKAPATYKVGTTANAPTAGTATWTLAAFANSYVQLYIGKVLVSLIDVGDGSPYLTKTLASDTITITNYLWGTGDILDYTLITPNP